jgi:ubiquitin carboxyl-terminal hydrolase 9/24
LEGDNAYFCEKCAQKRNTMKRLCIKRLPSTLVIQLKRFHYDWETNRFDSLIVYFSGGRSPYNLTKAFLFD